MTKKWPQAKWVRLIAVGALTLRLYRSVSASCAANGRRVRVGRLLSSFGSDLASAYRGRLTEGDAPLPVSQPAPAAAGAPPS